jgi:hypothetical protein
MDYRLKNLPGPLAPLARFALTGVVAAFICGVFGVGALPPAVAAAGWETIAPGLAIAAFQVGSNASDPPIVVLRVQPRQWKLRLLCADQTNHRDGLTAKQWCRRFGLAAAINAGMFAKNHRTHIGYLRSGRHVNNANINRYRSAVAFTPQSPGLPPARIFDLDEQPLKDVLVHYESVAQNLRLIKRPGMNRWAPQSRKWSEAALGEDDAGRLLFIHARTPFCMHAFNEILLRLPIGLVCAQHLEGGPEAQLYLRYGQVEREFVGSYETGFNPNFSNLKAWPIPNILAVEPRPPQNP